MLLTLPPSWNMKKSFQSSWTVFYKHINFSMVLFFLKSLILQNLQWNFSQSSFSLGDTCQWSILNKLEKGILNNFLVSIFLLFAFSVQYLFMISFRNLLIIFWLIMTNYPGGIYLFKVNNRNPGTMCEICSSFWCLHC